MSEPTVLHPRRSARVGTVILAVGAVALLVDRVARDGLFAGETLLLLAVTLLLLAAAVWFLASLQPMLVLDDRGFRAPMMRWRETVPWARVASIRLGSQPWGNRQLEVTCWRDAADHSCGVGERLEIPTALLPMKAHALVDEMQRRRSAATLE